MTRKLLLAAGAVLALAGCVDITDQPLGSDSHRLSMAYDFGTPLFGAQDALNRKAAALCPGGYEKTREGAKGTYAAGTAYLEVKCD
jgi:hypothetical protein